VTRWQSETRTAGFRWSARKDGRADVAAINSCGLVGLAAASVFMGYVPDRLSIRAIPASRITIGICLILASQATSLCKPYVLFFVAGAMGGRTDLALAGVPDLS